MRVLLRWAGDDADRPGLRKTPARVAGAFEDWFAGYAVDPYELLGSSFQQVNSYDRIVTLRDIDFESHCEHHLAPILGRVHLAYLPNRRLAGISKLVRLSAIILAITGLAGLVLVPLGLPGLWVMVLGVLGYGWLTEFRTVGVGTVVLVVGPATVGEVRGGVAGVSPGTPLRRLEQSGLGCPRGGYRRRHRRGAGADRRQRDRRFVGSFAGADLFAYMGSANLDGAARAGWGAVLGRAAASAVKVALGVVIAIVGLIAVLRS